MFDANQYALIDFGRGQKLERFGGVTVRRATPSVSSVQPRQKTWTCDAAFKRNARAGRWEHESQPADSWSVEHAGKRFLLKLAPSGQVGVFPEQAANWEWIQQHGDQINGMTAINLFGYTGGTTMALAKCGVAVTHVDAAKPAVTWARENAVASGMADAPIRWIVEDATAFMRREIKRGRKYQIVVADPPSFGRGPGGDVWKIQRDLPTLMELAAELADGALAMLILSCHTPGIDAGNLKQYARRSLNLRQGAGEAVPLTLTSESGAILPSGDCFRWKA